MYTAYRLDFKLFFPFSAVKLFFEVDIFLGMTVESLETCFAVSESSGFALDRETSGRDR